MVEQLAIVIREQRGLPTDESFYRRLIFVFEQHIEHNPFYKKTPRVFRGLTAFYVMAALAVKQVFPGKWVDNWKLCLYLYHGSSLYTYQLNGGTCPDVAMSEASRILNNRKL